MYSLDRGRCERKTNNVMRHELLDHYHVVLVPRNTQKEEDEEVGSSGFLPIDWGAYESLVSVRRVQRWEPHSCGPNDVHRLVNMEVEFSSS